MRKTKFIRALPEIGDRYELVTYRGQPALRQRVTFTRERYNPATGKWFRMAPVTETKLMGYVDRKGRFCFFYYCKMSGNKRIYSAAKKRVDLENKTWIAENKDRKAIRCKLHEESSYFKFMKIAMGFYGDKILLNG